MKPYGDKKKGNDIEERDSSGTDSDVSDTEKLDSVVFMKANKDGEGGSGGTGKKRPPTEDSDLKMDNLGPSDAKKAKPAVKFEEGLNEETVRRYLRRKPHTTKVNWKIRKIGKISEKKIDFLRIKKTTKKRKKKCLKS